MKSMFCGLCMLAMAGAAVAQTPLPQGTPGTPSWQQLQMQKLQQGGQGAYTTAQLGMPVTNLPANSMQLTNMQTTGMPQTSLPAPNTFQPPAQSAAMTNHGTTYMPADCCPAPLQKICVPEPATKTISHNCYSKICTEICLPKCNCLSCFSCCGLCPTCEGPINKYYLVKKVRIETVDTFKCTPTVAPCYSNYAAPAGELIPLLPKGK